MKKSARKLDLRTETIRSLTGEALRAVGGGFIMKDSIIVRTSTRFDGDPVDGQRVP